MLNLVDVMFWVLIAGLVGAMAYSAIALCGMVRFQRLRDSSSVSPPSLLPAVSVLKPLCGAERELAQNVESFCRQDYPDYEILFSVREETDPAVPIVRGLQETHPSIPMRLLVTGEPRYLNAKVHGLEEMMAAASHEVLVINDSDVRVAPDYLRSMVAPLSDARVGLVTCVSRGVPGRSVWSVLEALHMNLQFLPGVLAAWVVEGLKFALGPTMVVRKPVVEEIGGFGSLGEYLADDFVLGQRVAQAGHAVVLASHVPDHMVCNEGMWDSLRHRLRWERSSRYSRPAGFFGQVFMHSLPLVLLAWAFTPPGTYLAYGLILLCLVARALVVWAVGWRILRDPAVRRFWWLVPVQDLLSFGIWISAFWGRKIVWRGGRFRIEKGGKLCPVVASDGQHSPVGPGS